MYADMMAERAGGLGGTAHGTIQASVERSFLIRYELGIADEASPIFTVSAALAAFGQSRREAAGLATEFGDVDTADMLTEISRGIDQHLWFIGSHSASKTPRINVVHMAAETAAPNFHT